nr:uncharacterized protein LOC101787316 isoform X2 [Cavia porcellus]
MAAPPPPLRVLPSRGAAMVSPGEAAAKAQQLISWDPGVPLCSAAQSPGLWATPRASSNGLLRPSCSRNFQNLRQTYFPLSEEGEHVSEYSGRFPPSKANEQEPYSAPYLSKDAVGREENICKNQATSLEHSRNAFNWKMPAHLGERRPVEVSFLRKDFTSESMQLTWTLLSLQDLELPQGDMAHSLSQLAIFISWDQVSSRSHKPRAAVGPSVWSKAAWRSIQQKGRKRKRLN